MKTFSALAIAVIISFGLPALANDRDVQFARNLLQDSGCKMDTEIFAAEFASAMDRLQELNPILVENIRRDAYARKLNLVCDVADDQGPIYYQSNIIHMWKTGSVARYHVAQVFHEFLHHALVKIDPAYHNHPDERNMMEVDNIYACHIAVFPEIADRIENGRARLPAARSRCGSATIYTLFEMVQILLTGRLILN